MKKPDKCYVYIYLDPRKQGEFCYQDLSFNYEPFYVGKGTGYRHNNHMSKSHSQAIKSKVEKLLSLNMRPIVLIFRDGLDEPTALSLEMDLIAKIGRKDLKQGSLLNFTDGGEKGTGRLVSIEMRQRLAEINQGKRHSEETKQKMAQTRRGHEVLESTRQKISAAHKGHKYNVGRNHSEEAKAKMRKPKSAEAIANMKAGWSKRVPMSDETKAKIRATLSGRKLSEETKAKMRGRMANGGSFVKGQTPWNKKPQVNLFSWLRT
jgi:hypothetical protein